MALTGVVPVEAEAALTGDVWYGNVSVAVPQLLLPAAPAHGIVAQLSQTVNLFFGSNLPCLADAPGIALGTQGETAIAALAQQHRAGSIGEGHAARGLIDAAQQCGCLGLCGLHDDGVALFLRHGSAFVFNHAHNAVAVGGDAHCGAVGGVHLFGSDVGGARSLHSNACQQTCQQCDTDFLHRSI